MAIATSKTSPQSNTIGKIFDCEVFHIDQIPDAMRKMGWEVSAQIMDHWFSISPAYKMNEDDKSTYLKGDPRLIPESAVNQSIIKMQWALQFVQIQEGIKTLSKVWNSPEGIKELRIKLKIAGWNGNNSIRIGDSNDTLELEATAQVNRLKVGDYLDDLNDWYGAIGNATLKIVVRGQTQVKNDGSSIFLVEKYGYYIKDTYDFLSARKWSFWGGSEPLGIWSKNGALNKVESAIYFESYSLLHYGYLARKFSGYVPVFNSDFRKWQDKHNSGGDFFVFSDVYWVTAPREQNIIAIEYK